MGTTPMNGTKKKAISAALFKVPKEKETCQEVRNGSHIGVSP